MTCKFAHYLGIAETFLDARLINIDIDVKNTHFCPWNTFTDGTPYYTDGTPYYTDHY